MVGIRYREPVPGWLLGVGGRCAGCAGELADQLAALERKAADLDATSTGAVLAAYWAARTEWSAGAAEVEEGLAAFADAVRHAHESYTGAVAEGLPFRGIAGRR
ncbi:WXG100 family type VII secretion target [Nocardia sp. 004]|uniref:WXG100 family type VII secretion target n=1 Tax=Nocardia sp. 004 TaxID=3385978 RepID=UPI0039A33C77